MHGKNMAVIINTCNRPFLLKSLVNQIKPQLDEDDSIVIVNDGDPESVNDLRSENVFVVEHCKDYYALASGRNKGIEAAIDLGYKWGLFLDDDMEINKGLVRSHKKAWENKNIIYAGRLEVTNLDGDIRKQWWDGKGNFVLKWGGANVSFHLPKLLSAGGYDESFDGAWGYEDNELYHRLVNIHDWSVKYIKEAVAINLEAPENGNYERYSDNNKDKLRDRRAFYEDISGDNNN